MTKNFQLYDWQKRAAKRLAGRDGILCAPTGSGKTLVAYLWAGIWPPDAAKPSNQIIFTAPIKALSNERYRDLKKMGVNVGIETGDLKKNCDAEVLCCTQEIYTRKYAEQPNQRVIVDEFHYIATNPERSRAYIDGILRTHPDSRLLIMSATLGNLRILKAYLERITGRRFKTYKAKKKPTKTIFCGQVSLEELKNTTALIFLFSYRGVREVAEKLAYEFEFEADGKIESLAKDFKVDLDKLWFAKKGVGVYAGSMLPKEKLFVEEAYRRGLLRWVVGTDALSLGVNLPAEYVVFGQLAKYYEGPISKNEFLQMAGRAGRKGYYETGYVGYMETDYESFYHDTGSLYKMLLSKKPEPMSIHLHPDMRALISGEHSPAEEAAYIAKNSLPEKDPTEVKRNIEEILFHIDQFVHYSGDPALMRQILLDTYFDEFEIQTNLAIAKLFFEKVKNARQKIEIQEILFLMDARNEVYALLQLKKFVRHIDQSRYPIDGAEKIDLIISSIDETALNPDFEPCS